MFMPFILNPELITCEYYDSLIRKIDIYTEKKLEEYTNDDVFITRMISRAASRVNHQEMSVVNEVREPESAFDEIWKHNPFEKLNEQLVKYDYSSFFSDHDKEAGKIRKTRDYLNQIRDELINEVEKIQKHSVEYCESIKEDLRREVTALRDDTNRDNEDKKEQIHSLLFAQKFAFLVNNETENFYSMSRANPPFKLHLIVLDFYLNRNERELLA